jgi:hypothetical protein
MSKWKGPEDYDKCMEKPPATSTNGSKAKLL